MGLIERKLLARLAAASAVSVGILTLLITIARSYMALNVLTEQRQNMLLFLEVLLFAMPIMISMMLPIAMFIAFLIVLARYVDDCELTVCMAAGLHPWRLAMPGLIVAAGVAGIALLLNVYAEPYFFRCLDHVSAQIEADPTANLLRPGAFFSPTPGSTFYVERVDTGGHMFNLFIHQVAVDRDVTINADEGWLSRSSGGVALDLHHGSQETLTRSGGLDTVLFDRYTMQLPRRVQSVELRLGDRYLSELFHPDLRQRWARENRAAMFSEAHSRLATPLYAFALAAIALSGTFAISAPRRGHLVRIAPMMVLALIVRLLGLAAQSHSMQSESANFFQYLVPLAATVIALSLIIKAPKAITLLPRRGGRFSRAPARTSAPASLR